MASRDEPRRDPDEAAEADDRQRLYAELRGQLVQDRERLLNELRRENEERVTGDVVALPDVPDAGDSSVATEQADLRHAQIGRDVAELRQVEAALARFDDGAYGVCTRCGQDIAAARLRANPAAERCIACQSAFEKQYADAGATPVTRKV